MDSERGGHRIQRVPPTERRGRVHSSTVTVAVLDPRSATSGVVESDFVVSWYSGTGAGGQHRNKHQNSARVTHLPTGMVRSAQTRSRANSLEEAMSALRRDLASMRLRDAATEANADRRAQVGSGERSDRRRVWAFQRDVVEDLRTGRRMRCGDALSGKVDALWR